MSLGLLITVLIIALVLEGFFSGAEMALISADRISLNKLAQKGHRGAIIAKELLQKPEQVIITTLIGTNICIAFQATFFTLFIFKHYGPTYEFYSILILSPVILIFGELIPKTIYQRYSDSLAPRVAPTIKFLRMIFAPALWVLGHYTNWLSKTLQPIEEMFSGRASPSHREELRYLVTYGHNELSLKTSQKRMIHKILDFSKSEVKKVLIPLVNVDMVEDTITIGDALEEFNKHQHSRLPVYNERVDQIVGVLHAWDVFTQQDVTKSVRQVMKPAFYSPSSQKLEGLLLTMQKKSIQMAIVVNEYGGAIGLVTLEDLLEEIVGDIHDEYDETEALYKQLNDKQFLVHAQIDIGSLNELLQSSIPKGNFETLAGFLLQQFNRIPEEGDELYFGNLKFTVRKASPRAVITVHITLM